MVWDHDYEGSNPSTQTNQGLWSRQYSRAVLMELVYM